MEKGGFLKKKCFINTSPDPVSALCLADGRFDLYLSASTPPSKLGGMCMGRWSEWEEKVKPLWPNIMSSLPQPPSGQVQAVLRQQGIIIE